MDAERKRRAHKAERECRRLLEDGGWHVHYAGFLDYVCEKENDIIFVEVKAHQGVSERADQHALMVKIAEHGISCFIYRPDVGFLSVPGNARSDDLGGIRSKVPE